MRSVLGSRIAPIRTPDLDREITLVIDLKSRCAKGVEETGGTKGGRRLLLSGGVAAGAAWNSDYRQGAHSQDRRTSIWHTDGPTCLRVTWDWLPDPRDRRIVQPEVATTGPWDARRATPTRGAKRAGRHPYV